MASRSKVSEGLAISKNLEEVGRALSSAATKRVEFTDRQRSILASASIGGTLDAIALAIDPSKLSHQQCIQIADAWDAELRAALQKHWTPERIIKVLDNDKPEDAILDRILDDPHLTPDEHEYFMARLGKNISSSVSSVTQNRPAYLASITVEGFRGIGPEAILPLDPEPGLTIVYGANGSGKSSFVEAMDVLFTGSTARFDTRGPEWRQAWQNAHLPLDHWGHVSASFVTSEGEQIGLARRWASDGSLDVRSNDDADKHNAESMLRSLGWTDAIDMYRPILGYAELGPLFDEDERLIEENETPLSRQLRLRTNVRSDLAQQLWPDRRVVLVGPNLSDVILDWHTSVREISEISMRLPRIDRYVRDSQERYLPPSRWQWKKINNIYRAAIANQAKVTSSSMQRLARVYQRDDFPPSKTNFEWPVGWNPKVATYCELLTSAIYNSHLSQLSKRSSVLWSTIRTGSTVRFDGIRFEPMARHAMASTRELVLRIALRLVIDDTREVERGVLSQGEMHSLALSVFLPLMMQGESPFGFVLIDDPVQVMDEHAVGGLADALESVSDDLQVVVFTHDLRLQQALAASEIDHTLINVMRSGRSVVECEKVSDPVSQRINDARSEADRHAREDEMVLVHRQDVANQCRKAIEAALIRSIRRQLVQTGELSRREVEEELDVILGRPATSTRKLLAVAIWGINGGSRIGEIASYVTNNKKWGRDVHRTLSRVNDLYHARTATEAHEAYSGDLHHLIDDVEWLIRKIEENCG